MQRSFGRFTKKISRIRASEDASPSYEYRTTLNPAGVDVGDMGRTHGSDKESTMKPKQRSGSRLLLGAAFVSMLAVGAAYGQSVQPGGTYGQSLAPNQTQGFAAGKLVKFTYTQSYDCVDEPNDDLNYNGTPAKSDSGEFQTPVCQAGIQPELSPTGIKAENSARLFVLIPMFSINNDQNPDDAIACPPGVRSSTLCGHDLGTTLIELFGAVPEGYKTKPLVFTDCPNPGSPPGTCTMHASTVDLGAVLVALGKLPPPAMNVFLPTPNHSHVISGARADTDRAIWWEVVPVLVTNPADWPPEDGSSGITSLVSLRRAEAAGDATEVASNFFLFFSSQSMAGMQGMHR
jgi:hypothetical protein